MDPVSLRGTERPSDEPGDKKGIGKAKAKTSRSDSWRIEAVQRENDFFPNLSGDFDEDSPLTTEVKDRRALRMAALASGSPPLRGGWARS